MGSQFPLKPQHSISPLLSTPVFFTVSLSEGFLPSHFKYMPQFSLGLKILCWNFPFVDNFGVPLLPVRPRLGGVETTPTSLQASCSTGPLQGLS